MAKRQINMMFWMAVIAVGLWALSLALPQNQTLPHCDEVRYVYCPPNSP